MNPVKKTITILLSILCVTLTLIFINQYFSYTNKVKTNNELIENISLLTQKTADEKSEIADLENTYESLTIEKEMSLKEYENWQRQNEKLKKLLAQ